MAVQGRAAAAGLQAIQHTGLNGNIFVTFDKADPRTGREAVGNGLGVVDEFSTEGHLIARIASRGALNAPWGLVIAPASWGSAAGSLLIGNFGDGRINIVAKHGDHFAHHITGHVVDSSTGKPFTEPGLWGSAARYGDERGHRRALVHFGSQPRAGRPARRTAPITPHDPGAGLRDTGDDAGPGAFKGSRPRSILRTIGARVRGFCIARIGRAIIPWWGQAARRWRRIRSDGRRSAGAARSRRRESRRPDVPAG